MKKVVQFIHSLSSGGAETMVKDYAIELKKRGYDIDILVQTLRPDAPNEIFVNNANIPVISVSNPPQKSGGFIGKIWNKVANLIYMQVFLRNYFKQNQPDVLHIHLKLMRHLILAYPFLDKTKIVYTCHNEPSKIFLKDGFINKLEYGVINLFLKKRKMTIIALHKDMKSEIDTMFGIANTVVLNNPIDTNRFLSVNISKKEFRSQLNIPQDAFVIGHIGRFGQQKNHTFLVDIFNEVAKIRQNAFLLMIGAGELIEPVKEKLNKQHLQNRYLILSNRSDIPQLLSIMDVFCFPSLYEGFPLAIVEAQVANLPCFISKNIPEQTMLTDHIWQLDLEDGAKVWANMILSENKQPYQPTRLLQEFDIKNVVDGLEKIYFGNV